MRRTLFFGFAALAAMCVSSALAQEMHGVISAPRLAELHPFAGLALSNYVATRPSPCEMTSHTWEERFNEVMQGEADKYIVLRRTEHTIVWRDGNACVVGIFDYIEKARFDVERIAEAQEAAPVGRFGGAPINERIEIVSVKPTPEQAVKTSSVQFGPPPAELHNEVSVTDMLISRYPPLFDFSNLRASANN